MMVTTQATMNRQQQMSYTAAQIAAMPPDQQQAILKSLSPQQQALVQAEIKNAVQKANLNYMRNSLEKYAYCPVSGGSGTTAVYAPGSTLVFDLPVIGSAYAKGLLITYNILVKPATGTAATYSINAGCPWNIFGEIDLLYNGQQIRTHPYIMKLLDVTKGFLRGAQNGVLAGNNDLNVANSIIGPTPLIVNTDNTWTGKMYLPFNALGQDSVPGMLPIMGVGNKPQVRLACATSFLGYDPLLCPVSANTGTGQAITIETTSTINVDVVYHDGSNMQSPTGYMLNLAGLPTLQYYWDTPLNPLTSGVINRQHIATLLEHRYVFSVVMDGRQSNAFSTLSNLTQFVLSPDSVGQQTFQNWNVANNVSTNDYYDRIRRKYGQDFDEGVIVWVDAPASNTVDSSNRVGMNSLNMRQGGYPATTHGYQVTTVSSTNFTPRVETFVVSLNYDGLRIA